MPSDRIFAIAMVRNEEDVILPVLEHLLAEGVDEIIVADNLSTDSTRALLDAAATRWPITVIDDPEPAYFQAEKMTRLAERAAAMGATWIVPFDADEIWYATDGRLADAIRNTEADALEAPIYNHFPRLVKARRAPNVFATMPYRSKVRSPTWDAKVAFRYRAGARLTQGNHDVVGGGTRGASTLAIRHFPYRSYRQLLRKAQFSRRMLDDPKLEARVGSHWRQLATLSRLALALRWLRLCTMRGMIRDPAPVASLADARFVASEPGHE